mmetsp:Transcript_43084/g.119164  ORF Transcript_43084/g.119164 Transcript_43084/m.119164 type:complete len:126 (-) Transcript_43084:85-462(-)
MMLRAASHLAHYAAKGVIARSAAISTVAARAAQAPARRAPIVDNDALCDAAQAPTPPSAVMEADARVLLIGGALLCLAGSITSVYVAVTHDPNKKEDRPMLKRGEYLAGASVVGACALVYVTLRR